VYVTGVASFHVQRLGRKRRRVRGAICGLCIKSQRRKLTRKKKEGKKTKAEGQGKLKTSELEFHGRGESEKPGETGKGRGGRKGWGSWKRVNCWFLGGGIPLPAKKDAGQSGGWPS